jgi:hypothetical protein
MLRKNLYIPPAKIVRRIVLGISFNRYLPQNGRVKKLLLLLFIGLCSLSAQAQQDTSLQRRLDEYLAANKQLDFEKLMDYIYPKLFDIVPREQMIELFKSIFDNPQMTISMDSMSVTGISKSFSFKGAQFKKVDYYVGMSLRFKDSTVLKDQDRVLEIQERVKTSMNAENVKYIAQDNSLAIDAKKVMFAIKGNPQTQWMFVGYEPQQRDMMKTLVPEEVLMNFKL